MEVNLSFLAQFLLVLCVFFDPNEPITAEAMSGTFGLNYGRLGDDLPSPNKVIKLLKAAKIKNVRIYDVEESVIKAFSGSGIELVVTLRNSQLKEMSSREESALKWVKENVQAYMDDTQIRGIAVGNEIMGGKDQGLAQYLVGAVGNIYNATKKLNLSGKVQILTAHSDEVFANSFPPSSCVFKKDVIKYMKPLLQILSQIGAPFCLNTYPFLDYMMNPKEIELDYALLKPSKGTYDRKTGVHYDNMLDAEVDAAYSALEAAGFKNMEIVITETGWASQGDFNETVATADNAKTYNSNVLKKLGQGKGTPLRPNIELKAYIFAMFNENLKPGAASERNYGVLRADASLPYDIGLFPSEVVDGMLDQAPSSQCSSLRPLKDIQFQGWAGFYSMALIAHALVQLYFPFS